MAENNFNKEIGQEFTESKLTFARKKLYIDKTYKSFFRENQFQIRDSCCDTAIFEFGWNVKNKSCLGKYAQKLSNDR